MLKSHRCGELRETDIGERVTLAGWVHRRRDHGGLIFIDLRDSTGLVQVVLHPERGDAFAAAEEVRVEYVLQLHGEVVARRAGTENADLATGAIEVSAADLTVLNPAETPPFPVNQDTQVDEATRLRYRYLDLRRGRMAANLRLRHRVTTFIRDYFGARDFIEVETPVLGLSSPEGARDYLVPSRVHPGRFYALPQSPQQWKQLLMVAGVERYFQLARCYRDEDLRADRQPEFTQLDVEMAFVESDDVLALIETLYVEMAREIAPQFELTTPFVRVSYAEAMERYGSDKPDLRYGLEIADLSSAVEDSQFRVFRSAVAAGGRARGFAVPGGHGSSHREVDRMTELAREAGAMGLVTFAFAGEGPLEGVTMDDVRSPVARFFDAPMVVELGRRCGAVRGDMLLIVAGEDAVTSAALDVLRRHVAEQRDLADPNVLRFAWVTEFPMFQWDGQTERWDAVHHLFTSPVQDDLDLIESDPARVRAHSYDLVCNGHEIGGGSIRIHRRDLQLRVMRTLGIDEQQAQDRFGHLLEAFTFGAPPHGGIALGLDRTVALYTGERDIRDVIAFPKTKSAADLLTGAPAPVSDVQLAEAHIVLAASAQEALERASAEAASAPADGTPPDGTAPDGTASDAATSGSETSGSETSGPTV